MSVLATARGLVDLIRWVNAVAAGVLTFIGAFVSGADFLTVPAATAVLATVLATGGGNAINDYFDREIDRINAPDRPIPRGDVSPRLALTYGTSLLVVALGLVVATLPLLAVGIAVVNLGALVTYTELFKGRPGVGNALVAYLGGSTFLFGAAAVGSLGVSAIVLAALAAFSTLAREIIKDVEDIEGDRASGLRTLPIVVGEGRALQIAAVLLGVALVLSPLPFLLGTLSLAYLVLVIPADAVMVYATYRSFDDPTAGQSLLKYGMFLAAVAFIGGRGAQLV